ncbi:MAG: O-antigen ligase family protein, partial [Paracoccaceae bacterium]
PILGEAASNVMTASFVNRNSYATYAMFGVLTNLGVYLNMVDEGSATAGKRRWRNMIETFFGGAWIFAIGTLLCLAAVALTASRAGALSGIVGLIVFALAWAAKQQSSESGRSTASGLLVFVGLTALVGFIAYASSDVLIGRLMRADGEELRFLVYPQIIEGIQARPLLGHGLGAFQDVFRASVPQEAGFAEWDLAHSSYLENAFEMGLPAAGAFYLALGLIGAKLVQGVRIRRRDRIYACVALACFVTALVHATVDFSLQMPATASLFAVLLALGWSQSYSELARRREMIGG